MENKRKIKNYVLLSLIIFEIIVLLTSVFVSAFGVGFRSSRIGLPPGAVLDAEFSLQNNDAGTGVVTMGVTIEEGSQYVTLTGGESFEVPEGKDVAVPVRITVPQNARIGDVYKVKVLFRQLSAVNSANDSGTSVGFVFNQRSSFDIEVIEKLEEGTSGGVENKGKINAVIIWAFVIIVVIIIVWLIFKKKKTASLR